MSYTYVNIWRDGTPLLAYEVPEDKSRYWIPPMVVKPEERGLPAYPNDGWPSRASRVRTAFPRRHKPYLARFA